MHLRRLDLVGFKSFGVHTSTEFQPGIVVVVGPNGSGKSNIADAVLWVLGEQSAKAVRARKPEEVIFAGSASKQPLGMAEVALVLDNSDASLPIEYAEVRVARRLYRSGDSEYLLNGARVRLKDITQLLLHTGLSPDSYTVVGQGSIDELILQRPDERRVAFENVADIRRHQLRLNDTRSKLASTQANLTRVQDVLAELTPHVRRLKTQADRAERAEQFRAELHTLLLRSFRWRLSRARREQQAAEDASRVAAAESERAEAETLAGERDLRGLDERLAAADEALSALRPRVDHLRERASEAERSLAVVRERLAGIADQRASAQADLRDLETRLTSLAVEEHEAASVLSDASTGSTGEDGEILAELEGRLHAGEQMVEVLQSQRQRLADALGAADGAIRHAESQVERTEQHIRSFEANLAVDRAREADRETRLAAVVQQLQATATSLRELDARTTASRERLATLSQARAAAAARLERARGELGTSSQHADRLYGALQALGASDLHRGNLGDLPERWQAPLEDLPVMGLVADLAPRVRALDWLVSGYLRRIVVLADDASAGEAHRRLLASLGNEVPAWAVLSMEGLLFTTGGPRPIHAQVDRDQSALADWTRQVHQLEDELRSAELARQAALGEVQAARDAVDDAEADERAARVGLGELEARGTELRRAESAALTERRELEAARERAARAAEQRLEERERAITRLDVLRRELQSRCAEREQLNQELRAVDDELAAASDRVTTTRSELALFKAAAAQRDAERTAREALHARIAAEISAARRARESTLAKEELLATQQRDLTDEQTQLTRRLESWLAELEPLGLQVATVEHGRSELLSERHAVEQQLVLRRAAERAAREAREARHVAAQRALDEVERIKAEIAEAAELEAELTGDSTWAEQLRLGFDEIPTTQDTFDLEAARRRIATLQRELRAVGGVAESVVAEYRELSERHAFLEHQSADLRAAMTELETAASELETLMRDRFSAAFSAIQTAFQECFSELFGGGEARLILTEPDDLLRTGVDIVARPPGKKLQGLVSLSGGERALTIVSLLFGLLKINPTPFCVLDEVDAALDEANVQRFANLLAEFARTIQFIVVTHNRATMDKADAMYGVSMDAAGVSHVFSVRPKAIVAA